MADIVINTNSIGKKYFIGEKLDGYKTLRETLTGVFSSPLKKAAKILRGRAEGASGLERAIWALKDVSFKVGQGEIVGIIGKNGSGKSTLLKILSRITEPTEGEILIKGRVGSLLEVGTGFHPELTGRENIYLNGAILGMKRKEISLKFDEIVAFSEVDEFIDTPVKRYSSGMYLRLAFAVAAHLDPEILLIDEVLAVGDARFQEKCLNKMNDIGKQGRTVIFVSHHMPAVMRLCDRSILIENGKLMDDGPSTRVVSSYLNASCGNMPEREWLDMSEAPGGDIVRLRAIRVITEDGQVSGTFDIGKTVGVELEYQVLKGGHILLPVLHFYNDEDILAFESNDIDPAWRRKQRPAGLWKSTVWIPGNFMSEGTIFITPAMVTLDPVNGQFHERKVVSFRVIENRKLDSARGDWPGKIASVVRPMLKWTTSFGPVNPQGRGVLNASGMQYGSGKNL
ncbi:MAG: polysaccharide ABC transporter ATP-binding protein [Nitrospiraceae bacterium]|nr:polysaccharide ABC transporter ATP-binding protein [Nitrospiraceae bacterium]